MAKFLSEIFWNITLIGTYQRADEDMKLRLREGMRQAFPWWGLAALFMLWPVAVLSVAVLWVLALTGVI